MSATMLQRICKGAVQDGCPNPVVSRLAGIGAGGEHTQNCHRDLVTMLREPQLSVAISEMPVYMKQDFANFGNYQTKCLLPHEMFAALYTHHRDIFLKIVCGGGDGRLTAFWSSM
eukprot:3332338-Alexandrium_andersonii.AAC.1